MAKTILKGTEKEIFLQAGGATHVIGERINPTGRPVLAESLKQGDLDPVKEEALKQKEEGATLIDVNVGLPGVNEEELLPRAVQAVAESSGLPVVIDSSNARAIEAALDACPGRPLINSVTAEEESLSSILPLAAKYDVPVIALCFGSQGISMIAEERFSVAEQILQAGQEAGVNPDDIIFDPLVTTLGAESGAALVTLDTIEMICREWGSNLTLGASNVSFGLPMREVLNNSFLALAVFAGVNLPIINPRQKGAMATVKSADLIGGRDHYAMNYIRHYRQETKGQRG
ncbi:MAG: dihydropteroate synthase [Firmicutes bacterium]|nr:dihydropteroate synthase [Bacillota bacterium]